MSTRSSFNAAARKIERFGRATGQLSLSSLRVIGEEVMTDVKASRSGHGVPVDEGTLRSTGRVTGPTAKRVRLSFGGAAAPYAVVQHESLELSHRVGEPRYLVRGLQRFCPDGSAAIRGLQTGVQVALRTIGGS